ncbi:chromatin-remodeling complex subunit ies6 [Microsporum ferrugineum]
MAPPAAPQDDSHQRLLDELDIARIPKPFRNPNWKPSARRNKNVKQIISETSRKEASAVASQTNSGSSTPFAIAASSAAGTGAGTGTAEGAQTPLVAGHAQQQQQQASLKQANIAQAAQSLSTLVLERNFRAVFPPSGPAVTYTNIDAAPSLHPSHQKRYCDLTGLPAPYTDPKTRLRYHNKEVFGVIRSLGPGVAENYLEARGAHTVLK